MSSALHRIAPILACLFTAHALAQDDADSSAENNNGSGTESVSSDDVSEDRTVEIATERDTEPKAARLDYAFSLDVGYDSNVSRIPNRFDPEDSVTTAQAARVTYRLIGDRRTGVSVRGTINLDQVPELRRFDARSESLAFNAYKTFNDKLRLTADTSFASFRQDSQRVGDVRTLRLEASWQHNPRHRSLITYVLSGQELVDRGNEPDREVFDEEDAEVDAPATEADLIAAEREAFLGRLAARQNRFVENQLDPDGVYYTVQARHDANFSLLGKRTVFITALSYSHADAEGDSADSQSTSGVGQLLYLLTNSLSLESTFSYRRSDYDNPHIFTNFEEARRDINRSYSMGMRWVQNQNLNYFLGANYQNQNSSIPNIYSYEGASVGLTVEWRDQR